MSSCITALPLSSGESFILETDHRSKRWVILVDGGQSKSRHPKKNGLYKAIRKHCRQIKNTIHVAICTHRDHDHAGGFPAFIETWLSEGNNIDELWLPGGWSGAVEYALTNPDLLVTMLLEGAIEAASSVGNQSSVVDGNVTLASSTSEQESRIASIQARLNDLVMRNESSLNTNNITHATDIEWKAQHKRTGTERSRQAAQSWGFSEEDWETIRSDLETSNLHSEPLTQRAKAYEAVYIDKEIRNNFYKARTPNGLPPDFRTKLKELSLARSFYRSAIETAEAIKKISTTAALFNIPVRWFDFTAFEKGVKPNGGIMGFLHPLNAVELKWTKRESNSYSLFLKLTLTEQNVASLVFQRVESKSEPGVIFLGDSRLAFGVDRPKKSFKNHLTQPSRPIVYTAAHHGSRNNDHAYAVLRKWLDSLFNRSIAIRNGGVWNQTLDGFLHIKKRRCAQCYQCHGGSWSQLVQIHTKGSNWSWPVRKGKKCGAPRRK